jgi:Zn-dependent protease
MHWWVTDVIEKRGPGFLVVWCFWVVLSIVLHELAHGVAAIRSGDRTPIETGHMTWNPAVHMGVNGLIAFVLLGVTWGLMPVNPSRFRRRYDDAKVSVAGPLTNLWLALFTTAACATMVAMDRRGVIDMSSVQWQANLLECFFLGATLNFVLFALNLLPIPPLDGSKILANFSRGYRDMVDQPQAIGVSLVLLVLVFVFGGKYLFEYADEAATRLMLWLAGLVA